MEVTTIIPTTMGGFTHIARLMPQITKENTDVIVVNNNSRDNTIHYLSQFNCNIINNNPGKNFSQSNNQGARIALGDYLLFLNNDTSISPGLVDEMKKTFDKEEKIGAVGCLIYTMNKPKRVQHAGICFTSDYAPYELGLPIPSIAPGIPNNDPRVKSVREVPSVTAACVMVKKDVFEEVGGFDEDYVNGWEDTDLMLRIREKGYKIYYTGQTYILHFVSGSRSAGRFKSEAANRQRYDDIWLHSGRAKEVLKDFREA